MSRPRSRLRLGTTTPIAATTSDRADLATQAYHRLARKAHASATNWALGMEARARALTRHGDAAEDSYRQAIAHLDRTEVRLLAAIEIADDGVTGHADVAVTGEVV